jgi:hypothetical protein
MKKIIRSAKKGTGKKRARQSTHALSASVAGLKKGFEKSLTPQRYGLQLGSTFGSPFSQCGAQAAPSPVHLEAPAASHPARSEAPGTASPTGSSIHGETLGTFIPYTQPWPSPKPPSDSQSISRRFDKTHQMVLVNQSTSATQGTLVSIKNSSSILLLTYLQPPNPSHTSSIQDKDEPPLPKYISQLSFPRGYEIDYKSHCTRVFKKLVEEHLGCSENPFEPNQSSDPEWPTTIEVLAEYGWQRRPHPFNQVFSTARDLEGLDNVVSNA